MLVKAAINGSRTQAEHPSVPVTPAEMAKEAQAAVAAGAGAIHVHVRSNDGMESVAADDVARCLNAIRSACPQTAVGISTGAWIVRNAAKRMELVRQWTVLPDFASVNVHEDGAVQLMQVLLDKGIGVEAGVWNARATEILMSSGLVTRCLRILIEPIEAAREPEATLIEIEAVLDGVTTPRLLHSVDPDTWHMITVAATRGYDTRVGLEDTLTLPDGSPAFGNGDLVTAAWQLIRISATL
jgi:uncharacterized protein (DUF849 family)